MSEIQLLENLNHPNIIRYYSAVKDEKNFYIVLDFFEEGR
jgi:serine/threonine protein kinase